MVRSLFLVAVAAALLSACGEQRTEQPAVSSQPAPKAPPVAAAARPESPAAAPAPMAAPAAAAEADVTPPESAQCLELVKQASFSEAVPVCVRAVGLDPDNTAVQEALATARAKSATSAAGVTDEASKGAAAATGKLGEKLP